jgi:hypothetical protein
MRWWWAKPQRMFYDNQYALIFPLFAHFGVALWVPEIGGPIDPESEAHNLIMSMYAGMSKAERRRIQVRVRAAMSAQAEMEGRFLGGRPPTGTCWPMAARTRGRTWPCWGCGCTGLTWIRSRRPWTGGSSTCAWPGSVRRARLRR